MSDKIEMPKQCIDTGKAFIQSYGKARAVQIISNNILGLRLAYGDINKSSTATKLSIAFQLDFWSQVLESTKH